MSVEKLSSIKYTKAYYKDDLKRDVVLEDEEGKKWYTSIDSQVLKERWVKNGKLKQIKENQK